MNCYAAFAEAQQLENEGDNDAALAAYTELVECCRGRFVIFYKTGTSFSDRSGISGG